VTDGRIGESESLLEAVVRDLRQRDEGRAERAA
ncbi:MAG: hypothetical protein QOJ12_1756, partial [Thermoleophilales bacterium]|nr:hypothetical protein [Thermoleophilales bacterium]